jgi:hypothetical protein
VVRAPGFHKPASKLWNFRAVRRAARAALDADRHPRRLFESLDRELDLVGDTGPWLFVFLLPDHVVAT